MHFEARSSLISLGLPVEKLGILLVLDMKREPLFGFGQCKDQKNVSFPFFA
jgi:hypothetical protein